MGIYELTDFTKYKDNNMALTEQRIIKQITILPNNSAVNVQWADQVLRDGIVISETYHRKAYTIEQKTEFLAEVDGATNYIGILNW